MKIKIILICFALFGSSLEAKNLHPEKWYQQLWCDKEGGIVEYRLEDKTRVDCLLDEYAIEFDFGKKWAESAGQALYYAFMTGKKPGVVLILEKKKDFRYLKTAPIDS